MNMNAHSQGGIWIRMISLIAIAAATALTFAAFGTFVYFGGAWEQRTLIAMSLRTLVWVGISFAAWRLLAPQLRDGDTQ